MFHARKKHMEIHYHFVREKVANGTLSTQFVPVDIFTKALSKHHLQRSESISAIYIITDTFA